MDLNDVERDRRSTRSAAPTRSPSTTSPAPTSTQVNVNLAGTIGGTAGDAQADTVIVNGTNGDDVDQRRRRGHLASRSPACRRTSTSPAPKAPTTRSSSRRSAATTASTRPTLPAGVVKLTLDGGAGNDTIIGSQGADMLLGGDGNDFVIGDNGNDVALLGAGDDIFQWDPGDGSDTVEGQDGTDTLLFNGSNASENIDISANGGRVRFFRDVANVTMDLDDVETIEFNALGGADNIVVGDLTGTDVTQVNIDLRGAGRRPATAQADTVTVNGTNGADVIGVAGDAGGVDGLRPARPRSTSFSSEAANDRLTVNGQGGDDVDQRERRSRPDGCS